jgi:exonuclease-1
MVFDGMANKSKAQTEKKRKESRSQAKAKGAELLAKGEHFLAKKEFDKAVEIKHEHALALMEACRSKNVDCITSMYEADAQLAYLDKIGLADYIISEDSDLILFGCKKIIFKLSLTGNCLIFDANRLHLSLGVPEDKFSFEKFRRIAILSGCDYIDSLPGIGLAKAAKFMTMTAEVDMRKALLKIPSYLNMTNKLKVSDDYIEEFLKAEAAFKYMFVYDPIKKKMVRLNELEDSEDEELCSQTGKILDSDDYAYQLALGNINPRTFEVVAKFNPLKTDKAQKEDKPHVSIWNCNNVDEIKMFAKRIITRENQQIKITSFVPTDESMDSMNRQALINRE